MDGDKVVKIFGKRDGFPDVARLEHFARRVGVPVDVGPGGGDLEQKIAYDNHSSARKFEDEVWGEMVADLWAKGRALVFPLEQAERAFESYETRRWVWSEKNRSAE